MDNRTDDGDGPDSGLDLKARLSCPSKGDTIDVAERWRRGAVRRQRSADNDGPSRLEHLRVLPSGIGHLD